MKQLGHLEATVMQRLWEWDRPVAVREVLEDLHTSREIAYTTVMTVLDNLHGKGLVVREKDGRAYLYAATLTREAHTAGLMQDALAQSGDRGAALLYFVDRMSEDEIDDLRAALGDRPDDR